MTIDIIDARLKTYFLETVEDEVFALKEILQEIILYGLFNANFFSEGIFHGGTSLRILHGLPRFSEDLDFLLIKPNPNFNWHHYMSAINKACGQFGIKPEIIDKSQADKTVQKMFLKDNSIGKILNLSFHHHPGKKLAIKLEIDTNPPAGSINETKFLDFPIAFSLAAQDLSSNFAGKCHALLCRQYTKGRDWYDFLWYIAKNAKPNLDFLSNAIHQQGPWANQNITINAAWFFDQMNKKIKAIDWNKTASDVKPFLNKTEKQTLSLWHQEFFLDRLNKLSTMWSTIL